MPEEALDLPVHEDDAAVLVRIHEEGENDPEDGAVGEAASVGDAHPGPGGRGREAPLRTPTPAGVMPRRPAIMGRPGERDQSVR